MATELTVSQIIKVRAATGMHWEMSPATMKKIVEAIDRAERRNEELGRWLFASAVSSAVSFIVCVINLVFF